MDDKSYYGIQFSIISEHIMTNRQREIENKGYMDYDYHGLRKGYIISDDESGELLSFVKKSLRYDELKKAGKVHEITIDGSWDSAFRKTNGIEGREAWNGLVTAAYRANHGLLVITIENIKVFGHCWKLKQLAKQENPLVPWEPVSRSAMKPMDIEFIKSGASDKVMFDGNVLIVIKGMSWDDVVKYAARNDFDQFDAMRQFYDRVSFESE